MASYFEFDNDEHLALIPKDLRQASDLEAIAGQVERDVIGYFTRYVPGTYLSLLTPLGDPTQPAPAISATDIGNGYAVFLRGYRVNANDPEVDTNLKLTLRDVIANIISWRVKQSKENTLFKGNDKKDFAEDGRRRWPNHWMRPLDRFDTRPPTIRIG